jgi:hypothetical protein
VLSQLVVCLVVKALDRSIFERPVPGLDLPVGPGVLWLGQPGVDVVLGAGVLEAVGYEQFAALDR